MTTPDRPPAEGPDVAEQAAEGIGICVGRKVFEKSFHLGVGQIANNLPADVFRQTGGDLGDVGHLRPGDPGLEPDLLVLADGGFPLDGRRPSVVGDRPTDDLQHIEPRASEQLNRRLGTGKLAGRETSCPDAQP